MHGRWLAALTIALLAVPAARAGAAAGDLDPTFAGDGKVALASAGAFVPRAVAIDAANRIVVAGYSCEPDPVTKDGTCLSDGNASMRLARLTPDGGLDPEFGANGFVTTPVGAARSQAFDVALLPDGTIIAGGVARTELGVDVFALVRYDDDGALHDGFGVGGIVLQPLGSGYAAAADVAAGPNGTVLAAGQAIDSGGAARMAVARFRDDGSLDPGFGDAGIALGGAPYGYGLGLTIGTDGSVTTAGIAGDSPDPATFRFGAFRVSAGGAPDGGFGSGGAIEQRLGTSSSFANAVLTVPGGGWMAAGAATVPDGRQAMAIVRGTSNGTLDTSFGGGSGSVLIPLLDGAVANDVVAYPDLRSIAIGQAAQGGSYTFATVRLLANGALDPSYGAGGASVLTWGRFPITRATAGALQPDGRLVTVGIGCDGGTTARCEGGNAVLVAARTQADPPITLPPPDDTPPDTTPPDRIPPVIGITGVPRRITKRKLGHKGMRITVGLNEPGVIDVKLLGRKRGGPTQLVHLRRLTLKRGFTLRLKPRRRTVAKARKGKLKLVVTAIDGVANAAQRTVTLRLR